MSVKDYALELGVDSSEVLSKLKELGYSYKNENDILDDEAIIVLDNEMVVRENNLSEELADKFELEDRAEEAAMAYNLELDNHTKVKEKIKKKDNNVRSNKDEELSLKKKNIYKNKTKLQSNKEEVESNVVLYKEAVNIVKDKTSEEKKEDEERKKRINEYSDLTFNQITKKFAKEVLNYNISDEQINEVLSN